MKKTNRVKILIADDHPVVREGLVALINRRRTWWWSPRRATVGKPWSSSSATALMLLY